MNNSIGLLSPTAPLFEQTFPIRYHELDHRGFLRHLSLLNYMQDSAGLHAAQLGVSVADLKQLGLTWVLSRLHVRLESLPRADETVLVRTWPSLREGLFTCREFQLSTSQGRIFAWATSSWAVLSLATRRPVRVDDHLPRFPLYAHRALDDDFSSLPPFPQHATHTMAFPVLRNDLDTNHHVNNTVYVGWALESLPEEIVSGQLVELEISFRAEALHGERVIARSATEPIPGEWCLHQIIHAEDKRELARLRTRWNKDDTR